MESECERPIDSHNNVSEWNEKGCMIGTLEALKSKSSDGFRKCRRSWASGWLNKEFSGKAPLNSSACRLVPQIISQKPLLSNNCQAVEVSRFLESDSPRVGSFGYFEACNSGIGSFFGRSCLQRLHCQFQIIYLRYEAECWNDIKYVELLSL